MSETTRYPLCWPEGWVRTRNRAGAQFGKQESQFDAERGEYRNTGKKRLSIVDAIKRVADELGRSGIREETVVISTNLKLNLYGLPRGDQGEPSDPGVAVYWERKGKKQCMAIDRYTRVADNIAAIAATLEALRAIERHGGGAILDRAFAGFAQLPAAIVTDPPWRDVFGFPLNEILTMDDVDSRFYALARKHHSDVGGTDDKMRELNEARQRARIELQGKTS
jgi:hypothetical protein